MSGRGTAPEAGTLQAKRAALGADVDINKFVGGGVAVFDMATRVLKWCGPAPGGAGPGQHIRACMPCMPSSDRSHQDLPGLGGGP